MPVDLAVLAVVALGQLYITFSAILSSFSFAFVV